MSAPIITDPNLVIPTKEDFEKLLKAKLNYEAKQSTPERDTWNKKHFMYTPWGISWKVSTDPRAKVQNKLAGATTALRYFIVAIVIDWAELVEQLKRTLRNWGYTTADLQNIAKNIWQDPNNAQHIANTCGSVSIAELIEQVKNLSNDVLTEAVEKHESLNSKLFTKDEVLKDKVRSKMLEIVDEFLVSLKEQDIKIKVDDILFIGSNASYNYTKDSDIDLHILANIKATDYNDDVAAALYGAYRTIFNKNLDITLYDIPLEIFVETENNARVSNGIYSVKKNKWVKKPVIEDIPEYDTKTLNTLVNKWEAKCKELIKDIKADKLNDEKKVIKLLEDIYEKLRKKGISKGEYSVENLAFKELRNKGYLDQLKDYKNELVSKRLSLEENFDKQARINIYNQLARAAGTQPIIQDNGMFFIYNLKPTEVSNVLSQLKKLSFVSEASAAENGKYDFSDINRMAMRQTPAQYFNIRGKILF